MKRTELTAISPVDGRYQNQTDSLRPIFSEYALFRLRVQVEIEWLKALAAHPQIKELTPFSKVSLSTLDTIIKNFSVADAEQIKKIEQQTKHDVKAVEYFIRAKTSSKKTLKKAGQFIHFACTSEDINNLCHGLMLKQARAEILLPGLDKIISVLKAMTKQYAALPMLSRTHGQTAATTTLGKEIGIYVHRLSRQRKQLEDVELLGKMNGAVGNFNAHFSAYPDVNWMALSKRVVNKLGLTWNPHTTQIEAHDYMAEYFHVLMRTNTILIDLCRDTWSYISLGYFKLKLHRGEIGSSTMPHKVNPIDFENAEGNLGLANSLFEHLSAKLPVSRWQRDLSDSTVLRNMGVGVAYSLIAYNSCINGLSKLEVHQAALSRELEQAWEVLAEPVQTVLRRYGVDGAYEQLKKLTRGQKIDRETLNNFIQTSDIPDSAKKKLLKLTPHTYTGNAETQAKRIAKK